MNFPTISSRNRKIISAACVVAVLCFTAQKRILQTLSGNKTASRINTALATGPEQIMTAPGVMERLVSCRSSVIHPRKGDGMEDFLQSWKNYFDIGANTNPNHIHDAIVEDRVVSRIREAFTDGEKHSLKDVVQELFDELLSTHGKQIPVQMGTGDMTVQGGERGWWGLIFYEFIDKVVQHSSDETTVTVHFWEDRVEFVVGHLREDPTRVTTPSFVIGSAILDIGTRTHGTVASGHMFPLVTLGQQFGEPSQIRYRPDAQGGYYDVNYSVFFNPAANIVQP